MDIIKKLITTASTFVFIGLGSCSSYTDAMAKKFGNGNVTVQKSDFDSYSRVSLSPAPLGPVPRGANNIFIGASWSEASPSYVSLILQNNSSLNGMFGGSKAFLRIYGLDVLLNGRKLSYQATGATTHSGGAYNPSVKTILTESKNLVKVPLFVVREMTKSSDCRIRIRTSNGYEERNFSLERFAGALLVRKPMIEFLEVVTAKRH